MNKRSLAVVVLFSALLSNTPSAADPLIGARRPCPSPDGRLVAFDYQGDIWVTLISGGRPWRLTANEAYDYGPVFSPDGRRIAFNSDREGNADVYVIPTEGGLEQRITFHSARDHILGWSRDGNSLFFGSYRYELKGCVYRIDLSGGLPVPEVSQAVQEASVSPEGKRLLVSFGANPWWRKHYRGSAGGELWIKNLDDDSWTRLTETIEDERFPCWSAGGDSIFFVAEVDSIPNLHCLDLQRDQITVLTNLTEFGSQFPKSSMAGTICYESGRKLFALAPPYEVPREIELEFDGGCRGSAARFIEQRKASAFALTHGGDGLAVVARGQLVGLPMAKDNEILSPRLLVSGALRTMDPSWAPDDKTLVYASDRNGTWDLFLLQPKEKDGDLLLSDQWTERELTLGPKSDRQPAFSPNGKWIAFIRDHRELCAVGKDGGTVTILHADHAVTNFSWSPDSKYLAFSKTTLAWREDLFIVPLEGGASLQITRHPNDDFQPLWDPKGRWIVFASRTLDGDYALKMVFLTQEEFEKTREDRLIEEMRAKDGDGDKKEEKKKKEPVIRIDEEEIHRRVRTITNVNGDYYRCAMSPDGKTLAFKADTYDGYDLHVIDVWGDELKRITKDGENPEEFCWGPESKRIYYRKGNGTLFSVGKDGKDKESLPFSVRLKIDTAAERRQMLDEAWRLLRDGFYDSTMHGVDWGQIHGQYSSLVDPCGTEPEFYNLLREMIGELGASHLGVWRVEPRAPGTGELGIIPDGAHAGEGIRVSAVVTRSPAWMKRSKLFIGDIITAVDGESVSSEEVFFGLLQGTEGKRIILDVKGGDGKRSVAIHPITRRALRNLLREEWIEGNRVFVDSVSASRVGYLYVRAMGNKDWLRFQRDFLAFNFDKEALIIDVRGNSGGRIHNQILEMLAAKAHSFKIGRNGQKRLDPHIRWEKPLAVLIDERSYSDGEIFPHAVKALGVGILVGVPTNGSVIGTNDVKLLDGTAFRVPGTGWWALDGKNLENNGVQPDIYVECHPEEHLRGRDSQLQRAVDEMLKELAQGDPR